MRDLRQPLEGEPFQLRGVQPRRGTKQPEDGTVPQLLKFCILLVKGLVKHSVEEANQKSMMRPSPSANIFICVLFLSPTLRECFCVFILVDLT